MNKRDVDQDRRKKSERCGLGFSVSVRYQPSERTMDANIWDETQMERTKLTVGAQDKKQRGSEYDFVQEDAVEFVERCLNNGIRIEDLLQERKEKEEKLSQANSEFERIQIERATLPVTKYRQQVLDIVAKNQIVIIEAETGSGKTTQIPQFLHDAGYTKKGMIGCTQPRRVACMEVSSRVAQEMGVKLGNEVGYSVRFENKTSERTVLKYLTDGMLLREFLTEPDLESYSVMMIDEAHERSLHTDVLLGLIKDVARAREDLKIIISSATIDSAKFSHYFDDAPILSIPGRRFNVMTQSVCAKRVTRSYLKAPVNDYQIVCVKTVMQIHMTQELPGDILVFLTGQEDIEAVQEGLQKQVRIYGNKIKELLILPLYSALPRKEQQLVAFAARAHA